MDSHDQFAQTTSGSSAWPYLSPELLSLSPQTLAAEYANPANRGRHEPYGLTLFYHVAMRDPLAGECWALLVERFDRIVGGWVARCIRGRTIHEIRELSHDAMTRFWMHFDLRQFEAAEGHLCRIIGLLRCCAENLARDALRDMIRHEEFPLPQGDGNQLTIRSRDAMGVQEERVLQLPSARTPEEIVLSALSADEIWECIYEVCPTEREQIVAELSWDQGLKPRHIRKLHLHLFRTTAEISELKRVIVRRLRRHPRIVSLRESASDADGST
jgi:hypothetical protein